MNYVQMIREALVAEIAATCPSWDIARTPDLLDSYALLVLTVGQAVTREHVHDAWSLWSNRIGPTHRYLVPFTQLSPAVQAQDDIGRDAIAAVARTLDPGRRTEAGRLVDEDYADSGSLSEDEERALADWPR